MKQTNSFNHQLSSNQFVNQTVRTQKQQLHIPPEDMEAQKVEQKNKEEQEDQEASQMPLAKRKLSKNLKSKE